MVLSKQLDQSLSTAAKPEEMPPREEISVYFAQPLKHRVRSNVEQVARMQSGSLRRVIGAFRHKQSWMRAAMALLLFCGFAFAAAPAHGQSAATWNRRGQAAENREDYDAAFEAYRQAHLKKPGDLRYKERYERLRFQAAALHVDRGRVLRQSGDSSGALTEFTRALEIDPGDQAATQEIQATQRAAAPQGTAAATAPGSNPASTAPGEPTSYQQEESREIDLLGAPVQLQPVSNEPITLHMVEDTKVIYQAIGKAAGLNVIFDPEYTSKRIPVDLTNVSLWDALRIVGTLSGTFWKPVTHNTIFVAQNNRQKRNDLEDLAVQTFYLTNVSGQADANEIQIALRNMLDPSIKIYLVASQNALILRATPDELALAAKLIHDLDRVRSEVVVDVAVLEVSRDKIRNLGITLPTSFGLTPQTSNANVSTATTSSTTTATSSTTSSSGTSSTCTSGSTTCSNITLNTLGNINATNFAVSLSGGQVNALLSDSDTRILQNPRIRATDGQRATLKIGSKIPVATGSYSAGTAITTASLGVQTQFQYLDVGVNIDMTPTVHYDREVALKMKIEVSAQNGNVTISGVTEPIISQRVIEQQIQLREGEPSILAGILQRQDNRTVNGTPGLGELPLLKYFFSTQGKEQQSDEIVFLMIPHIVRSSILTDVNTRPVFTGTNSSVELLHTTEPQASTAAMAASRSATDNQQITAANAANSMLGQIAAASRPPVPPMPGAVTAASAAAAVTQPPTVSNAATVSGNATPISLAIVPPVVNQTVGSTFQVALTVNNAHDLFSVPVQMHFDPKLLQLQNVDIGDMLSRDGQAGALVHRVEGNGDLTISASRPPNAAGVDGSGRIVTLTFKALAPGDSTLAITRINAKDSKQNSVPAVSTQAVVHVK